MASTIKVDNVQNQPGTNIINKCSVTTTIGAGAGETINVCGATVNIGRCGGTVALTSGASQTGFGRTGTVDWDTTPKTGTVTAATGTGYFVDTTSGGITVNLPAGAAGSIVGISDYASTSVSNNITVTPNGSEKINGVNDDYTLNTAGLAVTLVYVDSTRGWKSVTGSDADATGVVPAYVTATGGTPCSGAIVCTDYKTHTFTGPGTLCVSNAGNCAGSNTVSYMVVAAGGGGGDQRGGGGGAGGFRESKAANDAYTASPLNATSGPGYNLTVSATPYAITVGAGGAGGTTPGTPGTSGNDSIFSTITSTAGGGGGSHPPPYNFGLSGGSGGGIVAANVPACTGGAAGNTPPVSPPQGNPGGDTAPGAPWYYGSGGGGATAVGSIAAASCACGTGGAGATTSISASPTAYAGGGGGGANCGPKAQAGGAGGGGSGGFQSTVSTVGGVNTGGGGGGGPGANVPTFPGSNGGSGTVIVRYKFQN